MKPQLKNQQNNGMVTQELNYLRNQVKELNKKLEGKSDAAPTVTTKVEQKTDLQMVKNLRETLLLLLVANENFFGPEKGIEKPKPSHELSQAMMAAVRLVKKPTVSNTTFRKSDNA